MQVHWPGLEYLADADRLQQARLENLSPALNIVATPLCSHTVVGHRKGQELYAPIPVVSPQDKGGDRNDLGYIPSKFESCV